MSTKNSTVERNVPTITTHAAEQWAERAPGDDPEPLSSAIKDTFEVDSLVDGDTAFYHAEYDMLLVVKSWRVVTVLYADHERMDTTSMRPCTCGCLVDLFEHDVCPRCDEPAKRTVTLGGGSL